MSIGVIHVKGLKTAAAKVLRSFFLIKSVCTTFLHAVSRGRPSLGGVVLSCLTLSNLRLLFGKCRPYNRKTRRYHCWRQLFIEGQEPWNLSTVPSVARNLARARVKILHFLRYKLRSYLSLTSSVPWPRGSLGHHRWFRNQFPPFFHVLHCLLGLGELKACPFPDIVFPPLPLSACFLPPFTVPCKMVLARPDERETWPYHCSLRLFTVVRRS